MSTYTPEQLRRTLAEHLDDVVAPPPDMVEVRRRRRRGRERKAVVGLLVAASLVVGGFALARGGSSPHTSDEFVSPGRLDYSHGLRAYADPGRRLFLGGRSLPAQDYAYLDTDAAATAQGIVFFDDGRPTLLTERGGTESLWSGPVEAPSGFHPTAKADAAEPYVAFGVLHDGTVTLVVRDVAKDEDVARRDLDCGSGCDRVVVDAIDSGTVFVRTADGLFRWTVADDAWTPFAGTRTRVADVRNRVVLYDGAAPTAEPGGWTYVKGAVDAQLTFDGRHVLDWSPVLAPVFAGDAPLRLQLPRGAAFFTIDTDGSVLAATASDPTTFYDCAVPSGKCVTIGTVRMTGGDPMFIGNDM